MTIDLSSLSSLGIIVEKGSALSKWTTFRLGGPCPYLLSCASPDQLEAAVRCLVEHSLPFILIGGGSNLVVSDEGLERVVVRYVSAEPLIAHTPDEIYVSGSTMLDHLAKYAVDHGLEGLNYTSGIPGTVGGAIVGNAGAFGKQVGDVLKRVVVLSTQGFRKELTADELGFSYRNSRLKETGDIVVSAVFAVKSSDTDALRKERDEYLRIRWEKHPDLTRYPCAGSFFRNIEPTSKAERRQATGWFLEQAGGKQLASGGARIFDKHANIIVKGDGCRAADVYDLSQQMARLVKERFGLELVREVRFVGRFPGVPESERDVIW